MGVDDPDSGIPNHDFQLVHTSSNQHEEPANLHLEGSNKNH